MTGYPPEDLLLRPGFIRAAEDSVEKIAREARGATVLVGAPHFDRDLYNACYVCSAGEIKAVYRKRFLPNYGVFDEDRYFAPGRDLILLEHGKTLVGLTVCEDMWQPGPPATDLALAGAELLVNISASPFYVGRPDEREEMFVTRARDNSCFVAFCNTVGGQDELIFDGHSCVLDDEGNVLARAPGFEEALLVVDIEPQEVIGRRLSDVRRRALAREREQVPPVEIIHVGSPGPSEQRQQGGRRGRPVRRRDRADATRARARAARLRRQERLPGSRRRRVGRDRLRGDRRPRGGDTRAGARALRLDALALLVGGHARLTPAGWPRASAARSRRSRSARSSTRSGRRSRKRSPGP